jgi:hypothetical protein
MSAAVLFREIGLFKWIRGKVYDHLILPFMETHDPLPEVARGAAIGIFLGLTPLVGVQMYMTGITWLICRYVFRFHFNATVSVAMVWVTNPVTTPPIYYLFLITGQLIQSLLGYVVIPITYAAFLYQLELLTGGAELGFFGYIYYATRVLLENYGWPLVMGSMIYAIPFSLLSHPATLIFLGKYRRFLADSEGISYAQWREKYVMKR